MRLAIWLRYEPWRKDPERFEVEIMTVVDTWAMVRRPGCLPFVESIRNLEENGEPMWRQKRA